MILDTYQSIRAQGTSWAGPSTKYRGYKGGGSDGRFVNRLAGAGVRGGGWRDGELRQK